MNWNSTARISFQRAAAMGCLLCALLTASCSSRDPVAPKEREDEQAAPGKAHPSLWPQAHSPLAPDATLEERITRLLGSMSTEDKVGQIIQADVASVTPEDVHRYRLGSILNGGNSGPGGDDFAPARAWLAAADAYYLASVDKSDGRAGIPVLWGLDAVHGHANIIGATIFPHNIALGATRDVELIREIGAVTAREMRVTGQEWNFGPTLAVVRDDRWGRTYESYSEDPEIVRMFATAMVTGLQGEPRSAGFLRPPHVISTAKHFLGDGGTAEGRDQGDNPSPEALLRDIHVGLAPGDDEEMQILRCLQQRFGRVSYERVLSGQGLSNLYSILCTLADRESNGTSPEEITRAALDGTDEMSMRAVRLFCELLGGFAGDAALMFGAWDGVYLAGGLVTALIDPLRTGPFRQRFEDKGRFAQVLAAVPTAAIVRSDLGLVGAACALRASFGKPRS